MPYFPAQLQARKFFYKGRLSPWKKLSAVQKQAILAGTAQCNFQCQQLVSPHHWASWVRKLVENLYKNYWDKKATSGQVETEFLSKERGR